jgi:hypothetical protein
MYLQITDLKYTVVYSAFFYIITHNFKKKYT